MLGRCVLMLLAVTLAGCADETAPEDAEVLDDVEPMAQRLTFASPGPELSDTFSGRFEFLDNDQFAGDLQRTLGQDPDNQHRYDLSHLVPEDGLFEMVITATADAAGGDIDIGVNGDAVHATRCDCPFGGHNTLYVYGLPGDLEVVIQYDEISSGPDDQDVAFQGVPYDLDVVAQPLPDLIPPAMPLALQLEHNVTVAFTSHTSFVTIHDPQDQVVAVLEPGDSSFTSVAAGEFVIMGQQDGMPFTIEAPTAAARFLTIETEQELEAFPVGQPASTSFTSAAGFMEMFACGLAGDVTADPMFMVTDPAGEPWSTSSAAGPVPLGWGSCIGTWRGHPDLAQGEWTLEMQETAGLGVELLWFTAHYVR